MTTTSSTQTSARAQWLTLVAATLASSMVLIDQTAVPLASPDVVEGLGGSIADGPWILTANILPLAAFLVLGGRIADSVGLRRAFAAAAAVFAVATALAGSAQDMPWIISARVLQGLAAAVLMPASIAITSAVWPRERRGYALGILAGASAFFAALGPIAGGLLTSISWRLVFLVNVPLAVVALTLVLIASPALRGSTSTRSTLNLPAAGFFALAMVGLVYGLSQGTPEGWGSPQTVVPLVGAVLFFALFAWSNRRGSTPLVTTSLFRRSNFLAAVISQVVAGSLELGLGYLLPFFLLLVIGVGPITAGLALIPGTLPIIFAGPLAGRLFDRFGGRWLLSGGFVLLAVSCAALALGARDVTVLALVPGLVLQGIALGVILTVNDPVGMNAVDDSDQGEAAGIINTAEQVGGALGIAGLGAVQLSVYFDLLRSRLREQGLHPTAAQTKDVHDFVVEAEQKGLRNVKTDRVVRLVYDDLVQAHVSSFTVTFWLSALLCLIGAVACWVLVRHSATGRSAPVFSRRSRWVAVAAGGTTPGITRVPPAAVDPPPTAEVVEDDARPAGGSSVAGDGSS